MKLGLPVKLGIVVVLIFAALLVTLLFWTPIKIQYYLSQVRARDVKKCIAGIEKLLALGEKGGCRGPALHDCAMNQPARQR